MRDGVLGVCCSCVAWVPCELGVPSDDEFKKSHINIVSSCELLTIWNSSNCKRNTRPVCSWMKTETKLKKDPCQDRTRNLPPEFVSTTYWQALSGLEPPADPTPLFYHRTHRWQYVSNRNVCIEPTPRDPPALSSRLRIQCPTIWKTTNVNFKKSLAEPKNNKIKPIDFIISIFQGNFVAQLRNPHLIVLSELPLTTNLSLYWRQAMPRLCPFKVRTNSHVDVFHTFIVLSPDADTMYFSSKSTTFTAALCPTRTRLSVISVCDVISQTAIERS